MKFLLFIFVSLLIISCSTSNQISGVQNKIIMPENDSWESINIELLGESDINQKWWVVFEDSILDSTMDVFFNNNYDLKIALHSLEASKALSKINNSSLFPDISFIASNSRSEQNFSGSAFEGAASVINPDGGSVFSNSYGLNLSTQWEIDIWGKIINSRYANKKNLQATINDYEFIRFSLTTQAVKIYFSLVEASEQVLLSQSSVNAYNDTYQLVKERYNQGISSSLDYRLSYSNLLIAKANLEQKKMVLDNIKRQFEVLLASYPSGKIKSSNKLSNSLPQIPKNLPSEIIQKRPDILSSYNKLLSSNSELKSAKKMFLPSINLSGSSGTSSSDLKDLLSGDYSVWNLGTAIALPLFQSGKIRANVDLKESLKDQAEIDYLYTVLKVFSEIENKLTMSEMLDNQLSALNEAYVQSNEAYILAKDRYNDGLTNLITVLDSQKRMFDTKSQMIIVKRMKIENRINLLLCLGGNISEYKE